MNCVAYFSFEGVSSDHRIVTAKVRLSLRKNATRTATTKHYDRAQLNNRDIRDKYALELKNRFETLQEKTEKGTPNDEYESFVEAHLEAASKCIPTKPRTKYRVPWETLEYFHADPVASVHPLSVSWYLDQGGSEVHSNKTLNKI